MIHIEPFSLGSYVKDRNHVACCSPAKYDWWKRRIKATLAWTNWYFCFRPNYMFRVDWIFEERSLERANDLNLHRDWISVSWEFFCFFLRILRRSRLDRIGATFVVKTRIIQFQNSVGPLGKHKDKAISWIIKAIGVFIARFGFDNLKYQFCFPASSRSTQKVLATWKRWKPRQNLVPLWVGDH